MLLEYIPQVKTPLTAPPWFFVALAPTVSVMLGSDILDLPRQSLLMAWAVLNTCCSASAAYQLVKLIEGPQVKHILVLCWGAVIWFGNGLLSFFAAGCGNNAKAL